MEFLDLDGERGEQLRHEFENDVKTYGTQAILSIAMTQCLFENDVKTYGTQAARRSEKT